MARLRGMIGAVLIVVGVALIVGTGAMFAYGQYERVQVERDLERAQQFDSATATALALEADVATAQARAAPSATPTPRPAAQAAAAKTNGPTATATVAPTATPKPPPIIRRVVAPSIDLDALVVESKIENGEWEVPKFVAGHLEGTALPGSGSNVVLSGHVESISSGNVFAHIDELKPGDQVSLKTTSGDFVYRIEGKNKVKNDDISVVQPTRREELTLITCTGTFNPITRDYSERWVVWGVRTA